MNEEPDHDETDGNEEVVCVIFSDALELLVLHFFRIELRFQNGLITVFVHFRCNFVDFKLKVLNQFELFTPLTV